MCSSTSERTECPLCHSVFDYPPEQSLVTNMFIKQSNNYDKMGVLKHKTTFTSGLQICCSILVGPSRHLPPNCSWEPHFCGILLMGSQSMSPRFPYCLHMDMQQWQYDSFITQSFIYYLFDGCPCHRVTQVGDISGVAELLCWRSSSAPVEVQCQCGRF